MLRDSYNRIINYLRISITDRCNLRCRYCMPEQGVQLIDHKELLTYEEIVRVIEVFARQGISKVRLTGGEPLVRRGVVDLIERIARTEGVRDLSLTTNGVLLRDYVEALSIAGLRRINISLDTLRPDRFAHITRRDIFHDVWEGVERSLRCGLSPVKINVVVIKGFNDDEVTEFARLSLRYPIHVRFIEFMPVGNQDTWSDDQVIPNSQVMEEIEGMAELVPIQPGDDNHGPAKRYRLRGGRGEVGFIAPISTHFCSQCNRLRLTPDGKIRTCLFSDEEIDLKATLRESGDEMKLIGILNQALRAKPRGHRIGDIRFRKCQRGMHAIGG